MKYTDINAMIQKTLGTIFTVLELDPKRFWSLNILYQEFGLIDQSNVLMYTIFVKLVISIDIKILVLASLDFTNLLGQLFL